MTREQHIDMARKLGKNATWIANALKADDDYVKFEVVAAAHHALLAHVCGTCGGGGSHMPSAFSWVRCNTCQGRGWISFNAAPAS